MFSEWSNDSYVYTELCICIIEKNLIFSRLFLLKLYVSNLIFIQGYNNIIYLLQYVESIAVCPETVYASARLAARSAIPRNSGTGQSHSRSRSRSRSCSHRPQDKVSAGVDATETHNSTTEAQSSSTNSCFFREPSS